jgi:hypothetical protein
MSYPRAMGAFSVKNGYTYRARKFSLTQNPRKNMRDYASGPGRPSPEVFTPHTP